MEVQEIVNLISTNGLAIGLVVFFLVKLSKLMDSIILLMQDIKRSVETLPKLDKLNEQLLQMAIRMRTCEENIGDPSELPPTKK